MKNLITIFSFLFFIQGLSIDTTRIRFQGNHFIYITKNQNSKVLFFLHGGVSNPYFKANSANAEMGFLLENNKEFVNASISNGFDLIIPVTNNNLNWISNPGYCFKAFESFLDSLNRPYSEKIISGFSDGGTGSFKIFYTNQNYFDGLVVFNGYPHHKNYAKTVDYSKSATKKVVFFGAKNDLTTPYEFMLTEYCKQKVVNPNTYLYVIDGNHSFSHYVKHDFEVLFDILTSKHDNQKKEAIHGYIRHDELISFYKFRKSIMRKYAFGQKIYEINKTQQKKIDP